MSIDSEELEALWEKWIQEGKKPLKIEGDLKKRAVGSVTVLPISKLLPHEEVTEEGLFSVTKGVLKDKKFTWPIFVYEKSRAAFDEMHKLIVLDGMHRLELLRIFCFRYIPAQLVEYENKNNNKDNVSIDAWYRIIKDVGKDKFSQCTKEFNLEMVNMSMDEIDEREKAVIIFSEEKFYMFSENLSLRNEYCKLKELEEYLGRAEYDIQVKIESEMKIPNSVAIFPKVLSKTNVIKTACRKKVFPPKTTRHIFQYRVYNIDVSLKDLQYAKSPEVLADSLRKKNKGRELYYMGRDIQVDRFYKEHMFKFK